MEGHEFKSPVGNYKKKQEILLQLSQYTKGLKYSSHQFLVSILTHIHNMKLIQFYDDHYNSKLQQIEAQHYILTFNVWRACSCKETILTLFLEHYGCGALFTLLNTFENEKIKGSLESKSNYNHTCGYTSRGRALALETIKTCFI